MTQQNELANVLAAESLLLALITFAYGLVYPELLAAAAIELRGRQVDDVGPDRSRVRAARRRARAFFVVAVVVGGVSAPPLLAASWHFARQLPDGVDAFNHYDAVATTLVLVTIGCFLIAGHAAWMSSRLTITLRNLSKA